EACLTTTCGFEDATRCDSVRIDVNEPEAPPTGGGLGGGGPPPPPPPPTTNTAPIAVAEAPATTPEFTVVKLGGSKSEDPDNGPQALTYAWKQTAGTDVTGDSLYSSTAMDPQFTAPAFANNTTLDNLTFQLIVYDGADYSPTNSATISITDTVVTPQNRTAALPDSWLVLYNVNSADSIAWKDWYIQQWGIPAENTLGLNADANLERILKADMIDDIFTPVVNYLNANPSVKTKVMGILVGYRVPGNYYTDANTPYLQGGGGWSVSSRLQKLDATLLNIQNWPQNSHFFAAYFLPDPVRITKATLGTNVYLSARIDAPTLADAKSLTTRARTISANTSPLPATESVYIDYDDVGAAGGNEWATLRLAYEDVDFNNPAWRFPWKFFESDGTNEEPTPNCAFRFSYYRLTGWQNADWSGSPTGTRILGYALNSWGATTVRSTTAHSGRYVPNLLFNGGFAGAVGATGEPYLSSAPKADTMLWCLAEGWTMGEATFRATPAHAWMWELVGDPLLRVPSWFPSP
ncbi:MAG: TIGR03790 family protein, partial [Planctomycetes bacterium]|nr:TIGR03790 family protein [Planctomycetota bacterium]